MAAIRCWRDKGNWFESSDISRIHMQRSGQKIDAKQTSADIRGTGQGALRAVIHNGDDAPLRISRAHLEQYEHRIYFRVASGMPFKIYYGDKQLGLPVYNYAKLFQKGAGASPAGLSAEATSGAYSGRPDERPSSERRREVLWAAMAAAVLILGGIALESIRSATVSVLESSSALTYTTQFWRSVP